jgi:hypothetical protein
VEAVFATDAPISIVPLDATDDVPVPVDLADRLATDHRSAAADLMYESLVRNPDRLRPDQGQQLWDELAALALTEPDLVTWDEATVTVGDDGRLVRDEAGRTIRYAAAADRGAVESALLDALRRGEPRAVPFKVAGSLAVTFDGTTCAISGSSDDTGLHELRYEGTAGTPSGVAVVGVQPPRRWEEVLILMGAFDVSSAPPDWLLMGPSASDEAGSGRPVTVMGDLEDGTYGPVCLTGTWPDLSYRAGTPFETGSGTVGS